MSQDPYTAPSPEFRRPPIDLERAERARARRVAIVVIPIVTFTLGALAGGLWDSFVSQGILSQTQGIWLGGVFLGTSLAVATAVRLTCLNPDDQSRLLLTSMIVVVAILSTRLTFALTELVDQLRLYPDSPWLFAMLAGPLAIIPVSVLPSAALVAARRLRGKHAAWLVAATCPFLMIYLSAIDGLLLWDNNPASDTAGLALVTAVCLMVVSLMYSTALDRSAR